MPSTFNREAFLQTLATTPQWDVVVIGGGATGLGIAVDSASRGFSTLLLEQADFAKGTSSRSTKLVHGGVRYLAQGDVRLVYEALHERGLLLRNAPHLVKKQAFVIPCYSRFAQLKFLVGLKLYDALSGRDSFGQSKALSAAEVATIFPHINNEKLIGGVQYFDGQFDDARLAINLAQTAAEQGASLLNYCKVTGFVKEQNRIKGVKALDLETEKAYSIRGKAVINATGIFVDEMLQLDSPERNPIVRPSQGVHLVVDSSFLDSNAALMIPETADGRVLFAVPWQGHVLLGTTDTPLHQQLLEPVALEAEINFILTTVAQYLVKPPTRDDVRSVFAGQRPLAVPQKDGGATKEISRSHKIMVSPSGLVTITGGKWTTYRKMAEDSVDKAIETGNLPSSPCRTKAIRIHGSSEKADENAASVYGTDQAKIDKLCSQSPALAQKLLPQFPYTNAHVIWAIREEMARTVEDVLARRLRLLFLDAGAALQAAPVVASLMANELGFGEAWKEKQLELFGQLARNYRLRTTDADDSESLQKRSNFST